MGFSSSFKYAFIIEFLYVEMYLEMDPVHLEGSNLSLGVVIDYLFVLRFHGFGLSHYESGT